MPMGDFHRYVTRLAHDLDRRFDPTPELSARPALQELLEELVADKEFIVIAEPRRSAAGCPDFVIKSKIGLNVGHIETKPPRAWRDLERDTNSEQLQRYRANFPNLLLTDYVHAVLLRDGKEIGRADLVTTLKPGADNRVREQDARHFGELLKTFLGFIPEAVSTPARLAAILARYAALVRVAMEDELNAEPADGSLRELLRYFKLYLYPGVSVTIFADAIAQSVIYALMVARISIGQKQKLSIKPRRACFPRA